MFNNYETVWTFKTAQFTVELGLTDETFPPDWCETPDERKELLDKIERGLLLYFVARVRVLWHGVEIGTDYLGGCCYESADDFRRDAYMRDMVSTAICEAREWLSGHAMPKLRTA